MQPKTTTMPRWQQRPRPIGFAYSYILDGDRLRVESSGRVQELPLDAVTQIRFLYAPSTGSAKGFRTELRSSKGHKIVFGNLSWRSLTDLARDDAGYRAFLDALAARIAAASPQARFVAGRPRLFWLALVAAGILALLMLGAFSMRAFTTGQAAAGWIGIAVAAASLWQVVPMIRLNRPRELASGEVPDELAPRG